MRPFPALLLALTPLALACGTGDDVGTSDPDDTTPAGEFACAQDDDGLTLPAGFCAVIVHEGVGGARHATTSPSGDLFVALRSPAGGGAIVALRDTTGDGRADVERRFGELGGSGVLYRDGWLYFAPDDRVMRWPLADGELEPSGPPETLVSGLPTGGHGAKSLAFLPDGTLIVNIGSASNACQQQARTEGSPGLDPCPELDVRAGVWAFDAAASGQTQADGRRYATGLRNAYALATHPVTGALHAAVHGRDQLSGLWPDLFTDEESAEKPAEEFVRIDEGDDFGWPYCYFDPATDAKVLAPEFGGDGATVGRCADARDPLVDFPAHWAPNDLAFYDGSAFPAEYAGGAFIAFHGSWNRAPLPQAGYQVVFAPFEAGSPTGEWRTFAEGFPMGEASPRGAAYRPTGLAVTPDGALIVVDGQQGRIWRIVYVGG